MENNTQNISTMNFKLINNELYKERLNKIQAEEISIYYSGNRKIGFEQLNQLNMDFSIKLLMDHGDTVQVESSRILNKRFHKGSQFRNARRISFDHGYGYVEGIARNKKTKFTFAHAWNVDIDGNHVDMTIKDAENFTYLGIQIPINTVKFIGRIQANNGRFNLPFLQVNPN